MTNPTPHGQVPEALRLALSIDLMDTFTDYQQEELNKAAAELRRLHAENERLSGLCDKWNSECDEFREDNKRLAALVEAQQHTRIAELEAELEAVGAGGVQALSAAPAGWRLVPVEPTNGMQIAADTWIAKGFNWPKAIYRAMLAASPTPSAEQQAPTLRRVERTTFPNSPAHRALHAFVSAMHDNHIKGDDMRAAMLWFLGYEECDATLQQAAPKAAPGDRPISSASAKAAAHVAREFREAAPQQEAQEPYSIDADPQGIRAVVADAITGALAFGAQGANPPPEGHWLTPFWEMAREEAMRTKPALLSRDTLYLLRRLLSNQHTLTSSEFRAELEKIVGEAYQQEAQEPCPTCAALARTVMLDQVSFDRKPDCYGIRQITDDEGVEEWEDIRTSPDVAREEADDMMATGRGEIYEVVPLWTTPQPSPTAQAYSVLEDAARWQELREQHESDEALCCVFAPNDMRECLVPVGSLPGELDAFMDSERAARKQGGA